MEDFLHPGLFWPFGDSVFVSWSKLFVVNGFGQAHTPLYLLLQLVHNKFETLDLHENKAMVPEWRISCTQAGSGPLGTQFLFHGARFLL